MKKLKIYLIIIIMGLMLGAGTGKLLSHLGFPIILIILIAGLLGGLLGKTMFIYLDKKLK